MPITTIWFVGYPLGVCMYVALQMASAASPHIDPKKLLTEFNNKPVQIISVDRDDPILGLTTAPVQIVVFSRLTNGIKG